MKLGDNMYQCIYCGNRTDDNNSPCSSCGSKDFKKYEPEKPTVIKKAPKDGYNLRINDEEYDRYRNEKDKKLVKKIITISSIISLILCYYTYKRTNNYMIPIVIICIYLLMFAIIWFEILKRKKERENNKYKYLAHNGVLVKNLPYKVISRDLPNHSYKICFLKVTYEDENGEVLTFESHPFFNDDFQSDKVDLLYDPNDHSNYFIDFHIY